MFGLDIVNGVVIGEFTISASLHEPSGTMHGNKRQFSTEAEAREWAEATRKAAIAEAGEACAKWLNWDKPWELRIYS